jgi:uncharacterized cupredoxin-like copper-binding protein
MFGKRRTTRTIATAGALLTLGVASLQPGARADASTTAQVRALTVKVVLRDFSISMSQHALPAGKPIRFVITNRGRAMHETVLERAGAVDKALEVRGREYEADDIAPGTTRTVTWIVPRAGTYQLACHMPGHFEMGMKTLFTVRGS